LTRFYQLPEPFYIELFTFSYENNRERKDL